MGKIVRVNFGYGPRYMMLLKPKSSGSYMAQFMDCKPLTSAQSTPMFSSASHNRGNVIYLCEDTVLHRVAEKDIPDEVLREIAKQSMLSD